MEWNKQNIRSLLLVICGGVAFYVALQNLGAVVLGLRWLMGILSPFLLGGTIAFILNVPMRAIERQLFPRKRRGGKLRRPLALVLTLLAVIGVLTLAVCVIGPGVGDASRSVVEQIPTAMERLEEQLTLLETYLPQLEAFIVDLNVDWTALSQKMIALAKGWGGNLKVAGTNTDFKILHGCEGYYFNDLDDRIVVRGKTDIPFDGEFVAFDLETTGLSSINDRITEVGAVILKNGKEVDRFQTLVDPERLLTPENTELTGITNEMLKEKILESANTSAISKNYQIGGLVDTYGAFVYGNDKAPAPVTDLSVYASGNKIDLTMTVPADEDGKAAYGAMVYYSDDQAKLEAASANSYDKVGHSAFTFDSEPGKSVTLSVKGLEFEKKYYVKVQAYSYGRNYSQASEILTVNTTVNNPPAITTDYDGSYELRSSQQIVIPLQIIDPDGHEVEVETIVGSGAETYTTMPEGGIRLTIKGKDATPGTYTSKVIATDEYGLSSTFEIEYRIKDNTAPEKIKDIENILLTAKGEFIIDMADYVMDPDEEPLKYDVTVLDPRVTYLTSQGDRLIGTALAYGSTDVTVVAKDARGEKVTFTFKVTVKDPSDPLSLYPNPVKDYLNVATLDLADTEIVISSSTGKVMFHEVMKVSAQDPARIDMTSYVPGTYSVQVKFGGKVYKKNVVKL